MTEKLRISRKYPGAFTELAEIVVDGGILPGRLIASHVPADYAERIVAAWSLQNELDEWKEAAQTAAFTVEVLSAELAELRQRLADIEQQQPVARLGAGFRCRVGNGQWTYIDHRAPDSFELEQCEIQKLYVDAPATTGPSTDLTPLPVDSEGCHCD